MRIAVIGGGLGGLALGHALAKAGFEVQVYEALRAREGRQHGDYLTLDSEGLEALRQCLRAEDFEELSKAFAERCAGLSVRDADMQLLSRTVLPPALHGQVKPASRAVLRDVLSAGLKTQLHEGRRYVGHLPRADGRFDVHFADGHADAVDLVVGADGADSTVRRLRYPTVTPAEAPVVTMTGRLPLHTHSLLPRELLGDDTVVLARGAQTVLLNPLRFREGARDALCWRYTGPRDVITRAENLKKLTPVELHRLMQSLALSLPPELRDIIAGTEPGSMQVVRHFEPMTLSRSRPEAVTLLGDAAHPLPLGVGVNAALRDAWLLTQELVKVRGAELLPALERYEQAMAARQTRSYAEVQRVQKLVLERRDWVRKLRARFVPGMLKRELKRRSHAVAAAT